MHLLKCDLSKIYSASAVANKRPLFATDCDSLPQAEQYRRDLIKDITRKISAIHNGFHVITDLYSMFLILNNLVYSQLRGASNPRNE